MYLLTHIKSQFKIVIRYSDVISGGLLTYMSAGILLGILSRSYNINMPLLCVFFANFCTGVLFGNIFCEKYRAIRGYLLTPWSVRSVILSKNVVLLCLSVIYPLPILIVASFLIPSDGQDYINAVLYFITSIPVSILLGNRLSLSRRALLSSKVVLPAQFFIAIASPIPYILFNVWLNSLTLCIFFAGISLTIWYLYELPSAEKNFQTALYNLN